MHQYVPYIRLIILVFGLAFVVLAQSAVAQPRASDMADGNPVSRYSDDSELSDAWATFSWIDHEFACLEET